ncbi:hypothetical protein PAXINDRAFT_157711 [Paxillus involutus ATCC 200175]|uniref:Uncharacterized protein n=1 Tax=Paxillus involutus ATCC 200175 TaxID=664439 RepID=A0A0C9SR09_PAXIN|nr:hypothetical protein PAXINDRAFT_157711 [Paxillus involutus ATCC 200175]
MSLDCYCAENLLVAFMTPGPQEPTGSQLQNYLKFIVDDLLKLYQKGIVYHMPGHPEGHQKSRNEMEQNTISDVLKRKHFNLTMTARLTLNAMMCSGLSGHGYPTLTSSSTHSLTQCTISYSLFSKRQAQFTKDWKAWQEHQEAPPSTSKGKGKKGRKGGPDDNEPKHPQAPQVCMKKEELVIFLCLSAALKIFCGSSIKLNMLPCAEELLQEYLLEYKKMYSTESMKPNFHWAVHLAQQIRDYGPVYNFWAFLSEWLNKVLKSSNSNNWTGGQVEISMMREFARGSWLDSLAWSALVTAESPVIKAILEQMLGEKQEASGTVQDAAMIDELFISEHVQPGPSVGSTPRQLSDAARVAIYNNYNQI